MKHGLKQMKYRFAVMYETPSMYIANDYYKKIDSGNLIVVMSLLAILSQQISVTNYRYHRYFFSIVVPVTRIADPDKNPDVKVESR